jgi:hypothetical protein
MKYFTPSLWRDLQRPVERAVGDQTGWERAFEEYREQLRALRIRLNAEAYAFFDEADVHDGELLEFRVIDGSRPAPLSSAARVWTAPMNFPVAVEAAVLDAGDRFVWRISYSGVRRTTVEFPGEDPLFYQGGEGFGDWGYDELTDAGRGFLRHEILFASGSIIVVEFQSVVVTRTPARAAACIPETDLLS